MIKGKFWGWIWLVLVLAYAPNLHARECVGLAEQLLGQSLVQELSSLEKLQARKRLRIATVNTYGLKATTGKYEYNSQTGTKTLVGKAASKADKDVQGLQQSLNDIDADIVFMQEVETDENMISFAQKEMDGIYTPFFARRRPPQDGIRSAFMIKNDLPVNVKVISHGELTWNDLASGNHFQRVFAHDLIALEIRSQEAIPDSKPLKVILGLHLKSMRSRSGGDRNSEMWRSTEIRHALQIIQTFREKYGKDVPIVLMGDFNNDLRSDLTLKQFFEEGFNDSLRVVKPSIAYQDTVTHSYHPVDKKGGNIELPAVYRQMDGILVSDSLTPFISDSSVYRYRDLDSGQTLALPASKAERKKNPSDHFPVWAEIELDTLIDFFLNELF